MSEHHPTPTENTSGTNPVKIAIFVAVGALALIVGIMLLAHFAIGSRPLGADDKAANTPEAVSARIAPQTTFVVDGSKASAAPAVATSAAATAVAVAAPAVIPAAIPVAATKAVNGEATYKAVCTVCHAAGIAGAPKVGDKAAWAPRIAQGKEILYTHAIVGYNGKAGAMPAKGGNTLLADAEVKAAVDYMAAQSK